MTKKPDVADRNKAGTLPDDWEDETIVVQERVAPLRRLSDDLKDALALMKRKPSTNPLATGFHELDRGIHHWGRKEVTIIAADAGIGKSTLATQAALHAGACGHGVLYFNLEMPGEMYGARTGANFAKLPTTSVVTGQLNDVDKTRFATHIERLRMPANRIVMANPRDHRAMGAARDLCKRAVDDLAAEGTPLGLVVVDHALKFHTKARASETDAQGKERSDFLREIAETCNAHVIALLHVTRDASKSGKMPTKNDLASSAWFDRDADNIGIFWQARDKDGTFDPRVKAALVFQKARWLGKTFRVELEYQGGFFYPWTLEPETQRPQPKHEEDAAE